MTSVRRPSHRRSARFTAAVLAAGLATAGAIAGAAPAAAQDAPPANGATATLGGLTIKDTAIVDGGKEIGAGLFEMAVDQGGTIQTYCIDFGNPTQPEAKYQEVPWSASSLQNNPDAGKINWILQNSYPQVDDLTALAEAAGADGLTENTAAAGTQIAIWRFSDKVNVEAKDPAAEQLADYLEAGAEAIEEPAPSLNLGPTAVSGKSGEKLGPVTVNTDAGSANLSLSPEAESAGVKVVDADGKALTSASDGAEVFLDVPAGTPDGSATLTAEATTQVPVGRAFAGVGEHAKSQTQILAGSSDTTVTAQATANWASEGPIPALSADKNCAKGGVDVTAENKGDQPFSFELAGESHTVAPGESKTVLVEVAEDQAYEITINGDDGFSEKFTGVLDCETAGNDTPAPSEPSPASAGGSAGGDDAGDDGGDLANTGGSSATPVIAGVAIGLVVVGGATVFLLRRRGSGGAGAA